MKKEMNTREKGKEKRKRRKEKKKREEKVHSRGRPSWALETGGLSRGDCGADLDSF